MTTKPHLRIVAGRPVSVRVESPAVTAARRKFGRGFGHEIAGNFLRDPELVLTRWVRGADYFNLNPHLPRPAECVCNFKEPKK